MSTCIFRKFAKFVVGGAAFAASASAFCASTNIDSSANHALAQSTTSLNPVYKHLPTPWNLNWDNRHPDKSTKSAPKPTATRHIILVRHGQYYYEDDDSNCHLTNLGRVQLDLTGRRLKQLNFPYSHIFYSTMTRAIESTDEIIKYLPDVPASPCDLIREGAPCPPEPEVPNWPEEGEKAYEVEGPRIESAFQHYIHRADPSQTEDSYEILVCHANVIRYFVCRALQLPPEAWIRVSLDHGSLTWLTIRPSGFVSLRWLGNSGFMPPDKLSLS